MKAVRVQRTLLRCSQARPAIAFHHSTPGYLASSRPISGLQAKGDAHTISTANLVTVSLARRPAHSHTHTRLQSRAYITSTSDSHPRYILPKDATVDQVGKLLADFRFKTMKFCSSVLEQREVAVKERLGTRALEWVMQLKGLDETHILSREFCRDLTWSLVAEDNEEVLLEWFWQEGHSLTTMFATPPDPDRMRELVSSEDPIGRRFRRRHGFFTSLIEARLCLSVDRTANSALLLLCAVYRAARNDFWTFGLVGAETALSAHLARDQCVPCDSKLYNEFCGIISKRNSGRHACYRLATMELYHPTSPDPCSAWERLRPRIQTLRIDKLPSAIKRFHASLLLRTMYLFMLKGAAAEARQVEKLLRDKYKRELGTKDRAFKAYDRDPKLQHLRSTRPNDVTDSSNASSSSPA